MSAPSPAAVPATDLERAFLEALVAEGLLLPTGLVGIYGRGAAFAQVLDALEQTITRRFRSAEDRIMRFPPVLSRALIEKVGYVEKFPHLVGCVCCFNGGYNEHNALLEAVEAGQSWLSQMDQTDAVLAPAACYAVYPHLSGSLPVQGTTVDVESWCYRHEPSENPMRTRTFRLREFVHAAPADRATAWRDAWIERGAAFLASLGLAVEVAPASDPFFGPAERLMASHQKQQSLKFELLVPIAAPRQTAVMSCNCHKDHFGDLFGIRDADGHTAHTACTGFGMERLALALLKEHGLAPADWSPSLRAALGL